MYSGAERAVVEWTRDLAEHGTIHFDEAAEERAFASLHASTARLFGCRPEDIAAIVRGFRDWNRARAGSASRGAAPAGAPVGPG